MLDSAAPEHCLERTDAHVAAPARAAQGPARPQPLQATLHRALLAGLDRLSHGVALLDVHGRIHYANAVATSQLERMARPGSSGVRPGLGTEWGPALRRVCVCGRRELLTGSSLPPGTTAVLTPMAMDGEDMAFVVFGRVELCGNVELQMFALRYQLTHAETMVLRQLVAGRAAAAIASAHGVARTTVLTQIASIRSKTQCASVRTLLGMLARMPPVQALLPVGNDDDHAAAPPKPAVAWPR